MARYLHYLCIVDAFFLILSYCSIVSFIAKMEFPKSSQLVLTGLLDLVCLLCLVGLVWDLCKSRALIYAQCIRLSIWCLVFGNAITLTVCTANESKYESSSASKLTKEATASFIQTFTISMSLALLNTYEVSSPLFY
jgi:hypothetical protein